MKPASVAARRARRIRVLVVDAASGACDARCRASVLAELLRAGDLVVVNDAATLPASLPAHDARGERVELRLVGGDRRRAPRRFTAALLGARRPPHADRGSSSRRRRCGVGDRLHRRRRSSSRVVERVTSLSRALVDVALRAPDAPRRDDAAIWAALYRAGTPVQYAHVPDAARAVGRAERRGPRGRGRWRCRRRGARSTSRRCSPSARAASRSRPSPTRRVSRPSAIPRSTRAPAAGAFRGAGRRRAPRMRAKAREGGVVAVGTSVVRALEGAARVGTAARERHHRSPLGPGIATRGRRRGPHGRPRSRDEPLLAARGLRLASRGPRRGARGPSAKGSSVTSSATRGSCGENLGRASGATSGRDTIRRTTRSARVERSRVCYSLGREVRPRGRPPHRQPAARARPVRGRARRAPSRRHAARAREPRRALHRGAARRFLLLAGDVFDGDVEGLLDRASSSPRRWRACARRSIPVVHRARQPRRRELGHEDACACRTTSASSRSKKPETLRASRTRASPCTGRASRSAPRRDDLAARYPDARARRCSTSACSTRASTAAKATTATRPTSLETMRAKGYDYWALGHVHAREVLSSDPYIVFPGNLQGRHARETGAEGRERSSPSTGTSSRASSIARSTSFAGSTSSSTRATATDALEVVDRVRARSRERASVADGARPRRARLRHRQHARERARSAATSSTSSSELRAAANDGLGDGVWLEKVERRDDAPPSISRSVREEASAVGHLARRLAAIRGRPGDSPRSRRVLAELDKKLPAGAPRRRRRAPPRPTRRRFARSSTTSSRRSLPRLLEGGGEPELHAHREARAPRVRTVPRARRSIFSAPGVHVVFGRNEAGKSTTLRAITGPPLRHRRADARRARPQADRPPHRRHARAATTATRVRVVRRKGNANTLLDERGKPLDEAVLQAASRAASSQETFRNAFGLDHDTLASRREGAPRRARATSARASSTRASAAAARCSACSRELEAEADSIYKPRATTLPLNDALKAFADAQKTIREKQRLPTRT